MSFNQSSYDTVEGDNAVLILITLNQPLSIQLQVEINTMDVTASGMYIFIYEHDMYVRTDD